MLIDLKNEHHFGNPGNLDICSTLQLSATVKI